MTESSSDFTVTDLSVLVRVGYVCGGLLSPLSASAGRVSDVSLAPTVNITIDDYDVYMGKRKLNVR